MNRQIIAGIAILFWLLMGSNLMAQDITSVEAKLWIKNITLNSAPFTANVYFEDTVVGKYDFILGGDATVLVTHQFNVERLDYPIPLDDTFIEYAFENNGKVNGNLGDEIPVNGLSDMEKARDIYDWIINNINYNTYSPTKNSGAETCLETREGVCEDMASLFVSVCLNYGVPARLVYGFCNPHMFPMSDVPAGTVISSCRHCWAEVLIDGAWYPVDPTFGLKTGNPDKYFMQLGDDAHYVMSYGDDLHIKLFNYNRKTNYEYDWNYTKGEV